MWERLKATGRAIKHRRLTFALVVAFLTIGVIGGLYAIQSGATFSGQTQAGDHEWYSDIGGDQFCANCHTAIGTDLAPSAGTDDGPHSTTSRSTCSYCHAPGSDHAASSATCADCHSSTATGGGTKAVDLTGDAHEGIMVSLGEDKTTASQTCQSCHTHAAVDMTVYADAPIPLKMGTPPP